MDCESIYDIKLIHTFELNSLGKYYILTLADLIHLTSNPRK